jgi:hypothetical protein
MFFRGQAAELGIRHRHTRRRIPEFSGAGSSVDLLANTCRQATAEILRITAWRATRRRFG